MAPITAYKPIILPDGSPGTEIQYADGMRQAVDANHQPVGAAGAAPMTQQRQPVPLAPTAPLPPPIPRSGGNFTGGWEHMRGGGGTAPPKQAAPRPTLQGPAGWAGPRNVGVHGGAYVSGNHLHTAPGAGESAPWANRKFNEKGHPYSGGRGTSALYDKFAAKGNAMESKVRGMASSMGSGGSSGSGWIPHKYGSSSSSHSGSYSGYQEPEPYVDPLLAMMGRQPVGLDPRVMAARYALTQRAMGQYGEPRHVPLHRWVAKKLPF